MFDSPSRSADDEFDLGRRMDARGICQTPLPLVTVANTKVGLRVFQLNPDCSSLLPASGVQTKRVQVLSAPQYLGSEDKHRLCALGVQQLVPVPEDGHRKDISRGPTPSLCVPPGLPHSVVVEIQRQCLGKRRRQGRQEPQSPGSSSISSAVSARVGTKSFKGKGIALYHPTTPGEECPALQVANLDGGFYSPKT